MSYYAKHWYVHQPDTMPEESLLTKQALGRQRTGAFHHFLYYTDCTLIVLILSP